MGFWNALAAFGGQMMNNHNINKQLSAQAAENEKNRQYNLKLAQMQNQWNIQQWNNENAYNSPSAQMERMKQAGLNPDMMYGGGVSGNLAANSPQMTSGAPSSPMDWSALGNKKTVLDVAMQKATLDQMEANTEKTKSETKGIDIDNKYKPIEKALGIELTKSQIALNGGMLQELNAKIENIQQQTLNLEQDLVLKKIDEVFQTKKMQHELEILANKAKVSKADAEYSLKSVMARVTMAQQQANEATSKAGTAEEERAIKQFEKDSQGFRLFLDCVDRGINIFDTILDYVDLKDRINNKKGGGVSINNNYPSGK